ncbi:MAG: hypothetical protein CVU05_14165 [Bacteroidetes bacterium HGW-Bacteroidetes-21]|jgi:antitoxin component YwqK of YwqJK toxin-antitoxin module|nr:MAG: hypothetical protein CVU05_14165 [Bacteroidetes bacterium HGW-Bacteroidetes-21]
MNKAVLLLFGLLIPFLIIAQEKTNYDDLEKIDGVFYQKGNKKPFTGQCYLTHPNGQLGMGGTITNGLRDGEWFWFYETGVKKRFATYKNGVKQGATIFYHKNGQKRCEIIFDNDQNIRQTTWDENGKRIKNPSFEEFK